MELSENGQFCLFPNRNTLDYGTANAVISAPEDPGDRVVWCPDYLTRS